MNDVYALTFSGHYLIGFNRKQNTNRKHSKNYSLS